MRRKAMRTLGKIILFFILLAEWTYSASIEATVSQSKVVKGNEVQLKIKATGEDIDFPRIDTVNGTPILGKSTQNSINASYVNGDYKSEKAVTQTITFVPKKNMTIPSYTVKIDGKSYRTQPIAIKVVTSKAPQLKSDLLYSFELKSDKTEVMAGESFILTLYISVSDRLRGAKLSNLVDPQTQGFFSKPLGDTKQYQQNGYTIVKKAYLVTANGEGNFTIGAAKAKLGETDFRRRDFFGRYATQWYDITSNNLHIQVKTRPQKSDLIGEFTLDATVDATEVKANKPVNLTVKIEGKGNLEDFEFPPYEIDGVTIYSDDAKVQSSVTGGQLHSTYTKNFAMISDQDFTIPSREFTVWNPKTSSLEKLKIGSYDIKVKGDKSALVAETPKNDIKPDKAELSKDKVVEDVKGFETNVIQQTYWLILIIVFILGMLVMYVVLKIVSSFRKKGRSYKNDEALQILYPHINESEEIEAMVRQLYAKKNGDKSIKIDKKALKALIEKLKK
jgi:hypothetical protein